MRKFCPNSEMVDGLETVLEVPIPEEMFPATKNIWTDIKSRMKSSLSFADRNNKIQLLLNVIGAPFIYLPINSEHKLSNPLKDDPIKSARAKYIIHQYIAAVGGHHALNSIDNMYAIGKVKMMASELNASEDYNRQLSNGKAKKVKGLKHGSEVGGFVLWSKRPDLCCLELVLSGTKICAGNDDKVSWSQTPCHNSYASRGSPLPLRRCLQGLDPRLTANLFTNSVCTSERRVNGEDCFGLKLEADSTTLEACSSSNIEIIRHTIWGYFSQRTGLLVQLQDSQLLREKTSKSDCTFQETTAESSIQDYRTIDGINIAHSGKTSVLLSRYDENGENHSRTRMEEVWSIEEVDFNIKGLTKDCFLPPADLNKEDGVGFLANVTKSTTTIRNAAKFCNSKVVAIDDDIYKIFDNSGSKKLSVIRFVH